MNTPLNMLAYDMGASNGRAILGQFDGERIKLKELNRFDNNYVPVNGIYYWDTLNMVFHMKQSLRLFRQVESGKLASFGVDTWGVDFGLLDRNGNLLGNPRSYRDMMAVDMETTNKKLSFEKLFARTGIANLCFNTIYQLHRRKLEDDVALDSAETLLLMPDLLGYFLSGEKISEYTNVTTTMLFNPTNKDWDWVTIEDLRIPRRIFTRIDRAGQLRGKLLPEVADNAGINQAAYAAVGSHDTASAVAAIPGEGNFAFCSSGTWSLFGVETDHAILTSQVRDSGFSNEGTVQGGFRPLKNIMGLWLIQECRRDWANDGKHYGWDEIVGLAQQEQPMRSIIDPDSPEFFNAGGMEEKIKDFCRRTGQPVPETVGQVARCVYESLALKYRWALERLEEIKGARLDSLNIVGGGIQNKMLNQMVADSIDRPVLTGPIEGAAIGNLLMQAVALGELKGLDEVRQVVRWSTTVETYEPKHTQIWEDAYGKLLSYL